jgi:hypothetical protein
MTISLHSCLPALPRLSEQFEPEPIAAVERQGCVSDGTSNTIMFGWASAHPSPAGPRMAEGGCAGGEPASAPTGKAGGRGLIDCEGYA